MARDSGFAYPAVIKPLLRFQLNGSINGLKEFAGKVTDDEWTSRPFDGANLIGFTVWHAARTIDWAVNCVLRDQAELVEGLEWKDVRRPEAFFGAGATREAADNVARTVPRRRVIDSLEAIGPDALAWLDSTPQDWFDHPVELKSDRATERGYSDEPVWAAIEDLNGIPRWQFLARPGISHIRVHYGEMTSQLESLRA
jgi:hypothetical protein